MTEQIVEADGLKWIYRGPNTDDHLALGGHEPGLRVFIDMLIDPDKAYVNVGSHVGTWAIRLASKVPFVWAFEANPETYLILAENMGLNNLVNSLPMNIALWDETGLGYSWIDEKGMESGGSTRIVISEEGVLQTKTLDAINLPDVGFIQMDVEGAEAHVLRGAAETIERERPNLLIELHEGHPGVDKDIRKQVYDFLEEHNYTYYSVTPAPPEEHLICRPAEKVDDYMPEVIKGFVE